MEEPFSYVCRNEAIDSKRMFVCMRLTMMSINLNKFLIIRNLFFTDILAYSKDIIPA